MEKRTYNPHKFKLNLKHIPPLDPSIISPSSKGNDEKHKPNSGVFAPRVAKAWPKEEAEVAYFDDAPKLPQNLKVGRGDERFCSTKYIDPNSTNKSHRKSIESSTGHEICQSESKSEDAHVKISAKSQLHEVCAANNWKPPLFECCKEEGPDHLKLFTYKVSFIIESSNTFLESFSAPQPKKKTAAEHAAEGALWYLNHLGYFPIQKCSSTNKFEAPT